MSPHCIFIILQTTEWSASIWRHQGQSLCNSLAVFQLNPLTSDCGQSNPYGELAEGLPLSCRITLHPNKNICLTANDCIFIAISESPFILPVFSISHDIIKRVLYHMLYKAVLCACVWRRRGGKTYYVHYIDSKRWVSGCTLMKFQTLLYRLDNSDAAAAVSVIFTVCKETICLCKYALAETFPLNGGVVPPCTTLVTDSSVPM